MVSYGSLSGEGMEMKILYLCISLQTPLLPTPQAYMDTNPGAPWNPAGENHSSMLTFLFKVPSLAFF